MYVDVSKHNPVLQTLSGPAVLLVWLYVMANVIVLGAEVNWCHLRAPATARRAHSRRLRGPAPRRARDVSSRRFQASPSSRDGSRTSRLRGTNDRVVTEAARSPAALGRDSPSSDAGRPRSSAPRRRERDELVDTSAPRRSRLALEPRPAQRIGTASSAGRPARRVRAPAGRPSSASARRSRSRSPSIQLEPESSASIRRQRARGRTAL